MTTTDPLPHLLTIDELADHLSVTVRHIRRLIAERHVPYVKVGKFVRFDTADIACWLDSARQPPRQIGDQTALLRLADTAEEYRERRNNSLARRGGTT
jgi:excisionase family DNA binding protein